MGKSFEMLGLAAFNVFLAMVMAVNIMSGGDENSTSEKLERLDKHHVEAFVEKVSAMLNNTGEQEWSAYNIAQYLNRHISADSQFHSVLSYRSSDLPVNDTQLTLSKNEYIAHAIQGRDSMARHETKTIIEFVEILDDGKRARAVITNYERGIMNQGQGTGTGGLPVSGMSYCEQDFVLSENNLIQMDGASCSTEMTFHEAF